MKKIENNIMDLPKELPLSDLILYDLKEEEKLIDKILF